MILARPSCCCWGRQGAVDLAWVGICFSGGNSSAHCCLSILPRADPLPLHLRVSSFNVKT